MVLAEHDPSLGTRRVHVMQSLVGGTGGRKGADGVDGRDSSLANCFNTPTECTEAEAGVVIETYALRPDSGGPGEWRGGAGLVFTVRVLRPGSAVLGRGLERYVFRPWGLGCGMPGAPARVVLNLGAAQERELGKIAMIEPEVGDTVTLMSAGGGGFGDPFARDPARVLADVRAGFVSAEAAMRDYGVAILDRGIDEAATRRLRAAPRQRPAFDFGPERSAWEAVFDDALMTELAELLLRRPAALRTKLRQRLFREVVPALDQIGHLPMDAVMGDPANARARLELAISRLRTDGGL